MLHAPRIELVPPDVVAFIIHLRVTNSSG